MQKFNEEFEELYGINFMTYNVHSTMHLEKAVSMCGPLWTNFAFPFEGGNGFLLNLVTGSNGVPIQIARKYGASISLPDIIREHPKLHDDVIEFYDRMMSHYQPRLKAPSSFHGVIVVGNPIQKLFIPTAEEITLLTEMNVPVNDLYWLKRVIYKGFSFASSAIVSQADPSSTESNKTKKKDDTLVRLSSGILARIQALIYSPSVSEGTVYALLNRINLSPTTCLVPHIKSCRVYLFDNQKLLIPVTEFEAKCMILKRSNTEKFITECFYKFDRD
ncbi:unnamed protein product [Bemisia tabaci]|uniref:Uncharacterized protein n=1 Tax=Bemisia tabaci TaxID=7038 RepID=A0A9P0A761_BEMTA|nr:unnamed protein product [Bemisia tabaci]